MNKKLEVAEADLIYEVDKLLLEVSDRIEKIIELRDYVVETRSCSEKKLGGEIRGNGFN